MIISNYIKNNTWAIILFAILISFLIPQIGLFISPYLDYLLMFLMFLGCLDTNFQEILLGIAHFQKPLVVVTIVHLLSPLLIFIFLKPIFDTPIYVGLVLAAAISAGRSIVFLSHIYGGQPAKALIISTVSGVIGPVVTPFVVWLLAHTAIETDVVSMGIRIIYLAIIPFLIAIYVGTTPPGKRLKIYSSPTSTIILFFIITGIISPIIGSIYANLDQVTILILIVVGLVLINFYLGFSLGSGFPEKITYGISSSYKNTTLSTILALSLFGPIAAIPSIVYTLVINFLLIPLQFFISRQSRAQKSS